MRFIENIPIWGTPDEGALSQIKTCALTADKVALMADHHKGYAVPIGGVVAYRNAISPSGVGFDIACGNKAVRLDMDADYLRTNISRIIGKVSKEMMAEWVASSRVELRGAGVDESPHCYKRLPEVLAEHASSIKILHTLTPIGVAMAGEREFDPYKD